MLEAYISKNEVQAFLELESVHPSGSVYPTSGITGVSSLAIVKPETVVAWHRAGFRLFWT
jgi:hypothetical protein